MDSGYKIYTNILGKKLREEIEKEKMVREIQMGFRKGRDTVDTIYLLKNVVERELIVKKKVYAVFHRLKSSVRQRG